MTVFVAMGVERVVCVDLNSGTPLQNRVGELYSQIRFLQIQPYSYYFCKAKGCDCKCLD